MDERRVQRTATFRQARRRRVEGLAATQEGLVSRRQIFRLGLTRAEIRANVCAGRWQLVGRHVVAVHCGPLAERAALWVAVLSGGPRAQLDGASSLAAAGLKGFHVDAHRVSVPRGARTFRSGAIDVRQTRRWDATNRAPGKIARTRSEVAAVRGALWAKSDKQAALLLTMVVQQRITTAEGIGRELLRIEKAPRLAFLRRIIGDLLDGAQSLGELDFATECRRRGLPEPSRQAVRQGPHGSYFLDVCWEEWSVAVEIDGIHHAWAPQVVPDALRHNEVTLQHDVVLRLPVLGLRLQPDEFFAQIERALRAAGCPTLASVRRTGSD